MTTSSALKYNQVVRGLLKLFLAGVILFFVPQVGAESYRVLVIPDNIVSESAALDSYVYEASSEFFADEVASILNGTDYINVPSVSETRALYKQDPSVMLAAKNLTARFRNSYNIDYVTLGKLAAKSNSRYVLLITSYIDAENYILRRTFWDFLNIPGASVVDPAYKISTYAVLIDTQSNKKLWADTFYKTISTCENRIITRGHSPLTEQLEKIKDYSRLLCPEIAQNVQLNVLPVSVLEQESSKIDYDIGNIDNVFTKKYRHLGREWHKIFSKDKKDGSTSSEIQQAGGQEETEADLQSKLEVKATPVYENTGSSSEGSVSSGINEISNKINSSAEAVKNAVFQKSVDGINYNTNIIDTINIKKSRQNTLYGETDLSRPELRDYN